MRIIDILKRAAAAVLAALTAVSFASCGGKVTENEKMIGLPDEGGFVKMNGDFEKAEQWIEDNITSRDTPPVFFRAGDRKSSEMTWVKTTGEPQTVTDYPLSDSPAERILRQIDYVCEDEQLKVSLTLTVYPGYPVVEISSFLTNLSGSVTDEISGLSCLDTAVPAEEGSYTLHYSQGSLGNDPTDYEPREEKLGNGTKKIKCTAGMPTCEFLPYFNAGSSSGGGVILAVNWQGNWFADFRNINGELQLRAGQYGLSSVMIGNERFKLPGAVLLFYRNCDWQDGQNIWRRWVVQHNLMRYTGRRDFRQNVYVCSDLRSAETDLASITEFAATGLPEKYNCVFELDAGWFSGSESSPAAWVNAVGNWEPAPLYSDGGLRKIADLCHENGMKFAMWAEPERLNKSSSSAALVGDAAIYLDWTGKYVPYSEPGSSAIGLINYGSQKAQDFVVGLLTKFVREYGIDVYRQDFNTENAKYWSAYDAYEKELYDAKRSGATENHACEGYINAWTRIAEENPGLVFDVCAGGGRRYDLESMRFGFMHTKSDYWMDVCSAQCQNLSVYSWNIFTGTGFADPSDLYDVRSRLTLSVGIGAQGVNETVAGALAEWSSLQKYMYGDYYRLSGYSLDGNATIAMQFCDPGRCEGVLVAYLRAGGEYSIRAKGLDLDACYAVRNKNSAGEPVVMTGRDLMEKGYSVASDDGARHAAVIIYETIEKTIAFE